ncbi:MAG TPA: kelch repeat-containing protein, partial [Polyangiaceae bacterium]
VPQGGSAGGGGMDVVCASTCGAPQQCCGTACTDIAIDAQNCGSCGNACEKGRTCATGTCSVGWLTMAAPPLGFVGRTRAASVAMGRSVFIWGGLDNSGNALDTGAIYSPVTDDWVNVVNGLGMLTPRSMATAVWTGSVVIVFGGIDGTGNLLKDAAAYDPQSKLWSALPSAATARSQPLGFWDGAYAIFWGGATTSGTAIAGAGRFDLTSWAAASKTGDPGQLLFPAVGFDGSIVYFLGGIINGTRQDKVFSYTTNTDNWSTLSKSLSARSSAFGVWDGSHFVVWGGRDDSALRNDGKYLSGSTWVSMGAIAAPSARSLSARRGGWAFAVHPGVIAVLGGNVSLNGTVMSANGATYDVAGNTWKPILDWPTSEPHDYGMGVWTGEAFVVWSGLDNANKVTTTGQRLTF